MATIESPVSGRVIAVPVATGQTVTAGTAVAIIECMKMEIPVEAHTDGTIADIRVTKGAEVKEGDIVALLK